MMFNVEPFGKDAKLYIIENSSGTRLAVTDIGACLVSLVFQGVDIALGWDDAEAYRRGDYYLGATVGRNCNRIAGGAFTVNGKTYQMAKNDGENNLHSGPDGYETRLWQVADHSDAAVTFFMDSPDGDQGFPGRLKLWASYTLTEDNRVIIDYLGEPDADTVVNITNHTYFNLNGQGSGDVHGHVLRLNASRFTPAGPGLIPTGEIVPVAGTPFDFTNAKAIGMDIDADDPLLLSAGGYDHNFLLDGKGMRPAAELTGDRTGITLTVSTDRPAMQLYSGNFLDVAQAKGGKAYGKRSAVCLETQHVPNAVNESAFPSPVVKAGEKYVSRTVWQLKKG